MAAEARSPGRGQEGQGDIQAVDRTAYVGFGLGGERLAVPMERVLEIIREPRTVAVPLAPRCLVGLANLRGTALPVVDLRLALGLEPSASTEATRVLVMECAGAVGLRVDRVERVFDVPADLVRSPGEVRTRFGAEALEGVIVHENGEIVCVLDMERVLGASLGEAASTGRLEPAGETPAGPGPGRSEGVGGEEPDDADEQFVVVAVEGEEYAFPIESVEEIVRYPERVSEVPGSGAELLGLMELRGAVLPLVDLGRFLGLGSREPTEATRVVVVRPGWGRARVGVMVDRVCEVLQVPASLREPVPRVLRQRSGLERLAEVCRVGDSRLVSVVNVSALASAGGVEQALGGEAGAPAGAGQTGRYEEDEGRVVVFQVGDETYGVDVSSVREIIRVPAAFTRVPRSPAFVVGLANLRGAALPVVDLRVCLGLGPGELTESQRVLVLEVSGARAGFMVDAVSEIRRMEERALEALPPLTDVQARLVRHVLRLSEGSRPVLVVDAEALVDRVGREQGERAWAQAA